MNFTKTQIAATIEALRNQREISSASLDEAAQMLETLQQIAADEERREEQHGREQACAQMRSVSAMVAALGVDYDRLEELREKRKAGSWVAGWNMPGCMPDAEPAAFETCDEARDYIADSMREDAESEADSREETGDRTHSDNATTIDEAASMLRQSIGDRDADYGQTVGRFHYWITHKPGELADEEEAKELAELEEAAGDCESEEEARQRIEEDALAVDVRSGWASSASGMTPDEFRIVLCTGGPHVEIQGDLDDHGEPARCRLLYSDWFQGLTEYFGDDLDRDALARYASVFYFGK